jgi:hypothetical protein
MRGGIRLHLAFRSGEIDDSESGDHGRGAEPAGVAAANADRQGRTGEIGSGIVTLLLLAWATMPVYLEVVSPLENIVEDLKMLPPDRLKMAASYIRQLKPISQAEREAALARTFGCLSPEEADEMERVIEEGCEQINERAW